MAEVDSRLNQADSDRNPAVEAQKLKYLEFIKSTSFQAAIYFSKVYVFAKSKSGPLKPSVETLENSLKSVAMPLYHKFHHVPSDLLKFADRKIDSSVIILDRRFRPVVSKAQKAPEVARSTADRAGVVEKASGIAKSMYSKCEPTAKELYSKYEPTAKEIYSKYKPKAEQLAGSAWLKVNQLPLFPHAASYCGDKYDKTVRFAAEKGWDRAFGSFRKEEAEPLDAKAATSAPSSGL